MRLHLSRIALVSISLVLLWVPLTYAQAVHALFNLDSPAAGPFPSDRFTVGDASHNTGRRVAMPFPDCAERPSDCEDLAVINTLDGFNLQPRLSIPFDGPIDVMTVTSDTIFLISLGSTLPGGDQGGPVIGINQIVWDTFTTTLHVESDEFLDQHTRYALIVTRGVHDASGAPVEATEAFRRFRQTVRGEYKHALLEAIHAARRIGVREDDIAGASVFTTQSVTAILEKIRDQIKAATPEPADFNLGPGGTRTVFARSEVTGIVFRQQIGTAPTFMNFTVPIGQLEITPGAVSQIAFGKYLSPDYQSEPAVIPPVGTRTGTPLVQRVNEIYFNLFLPTGTKPPAGWPVVIYGGGGNQSKDEGPFKVAATMANHGIATISINAVGVGFGPLGTLTVNRTMGGPVTFPAGGRGIDQNGDTIIETREGDRALPPKTIVWERDGLRQTAVDFLQLVREIEVGMDVDGDSIADLDSSRIYYSGWSQGARSGAMVLAVEPSVGTGTLTIVGGPLPELLRFGPARRPVLGAVLQSRVPPLLNSPGITSLDGVVVPPPHWNENKPLRNQPPVINTAPGAMDIQELLENTEWVGQSGDSMAYAPHFRRSPLAGVPPKSVLLQFAKGDQTSPNPTGTSVIRAGDLADRTTLYRNDLAFAEDGRVPRNPHQFMTNLITSPVPLVFAIARGAQEQIAVFLASHGNDVILPEPARFFEVPIVLPLPETLSFIP